MSNYKIRVNSEAESKEVQELFSEFGLNMNDWSEFALPKYISNFIDGEFSDYSIYDSGINDWKEITLPGLRDLVVLKRNSIDDATHTDSTTHKRKGYLTCDGVEYLWSYGDFSWKEINIHTFESTGMKPIEKEEMKEYLRKNSNGTYSYIGPVHTDHVHDFMIEIPEGATAARLCDDVEFYKNDFGVFFSLTSGNWLNTISPRGVLMKNIVWQRHTHPEELPFIDDEPKITTAKGDELDYIAKTHDMRDRYDGESDEDYRYQLEHYISRKEPSLNDQYAEIEKVRQSHRTASETSNPTIKETLNQRQSQYGSFEDVAMITEQMVDVMRKGYYENLAYNQKMALYMICSKMARIVNGDPNHKDSWHDIAGYATLIDNELESEKDMPF